ncbi:MAG: glycosyltransferase family 9 protein [Chloroflexia bacterium]
MLINPLLRLLTVAFAPSRWRAPRRLHDPKRILVIKPCCFGDVVMATAAVAALARAYPGARISMAVGAWSRPAVEGNPRIAETVDIGQVGTAPLRWSWREYLGLARRLRAGRYDAVLVLDRSPLLGLLAWLAGARVRAGLDSAGRGFALTNRVPCLPDMPRHEAAWYLDVVRALGVQVGEATPTEFYPTDAEQADADAALAELGLDPRRDLLIALHTGGGSNPGMRLPAKRWAPDRWAALLDRLLTTYPDARVLLLGGPSDDDRAAAASIRGGLTVGADRVHDLVGCCSWGALGALMGRCRLFLGHDTGAMHLAVAAGTPAVAVFGPSDPRRYAPWDPSGRSRVVGGETGGPMLAARAADLAGVPFHESVTVDDVWKAVSSFEF